MAARKLTITNQGRSFDLALTKLDRDKVYGRIERRTQDRHGNECYLGSISQDGLHVFGTESFEQGYLDADGTWLERSQLTAVDLDGAPLETHESSLKAPLALVEEVPIDDYLSHVAKSVYQLTGDGIGELLEIAESCSGILCCQFNYVASFHQDPAFLIPLDQSLFLVVCTKTDVDFVGPDETAALPSLESEEEEGEVDIMDFSMM